MATEQDDEGPVLGRYPDDWHLYWKWGFAPGIPADPDAIPTTRFLVLAGQAFTLTRWKGGTTVRAEISLREFSQRTGVKAPLDGWYDLAGEFLGEEPAPE